MVASTLGWAVDVRAEPGVAQAAEPVTTAALHAATGGLVVTPELDAHRLPLGGSDAPAAAPDGRLATGLAAVDVRLWMWRGRTGVALGVGTLSHALPPAGNHGVSAVTLTGARPTVSVGMRYRMSPESAVFADASGARAWTPDTGSYLRTKVGLEWKPATSRMGFDRGMLGLQFDSGYKLSLKARRDGVRVYLRGQF